MQGLHAAVDSTLRRDAATSSTFSCDIAYSVSPTALRASLAVVEVVASARSFRRAAVWTCASRRVMSIAAAAVPWFASRRTSRRSSPASMCCSTSMLQSRPGGSPVPKPPGVCPRVLDSRPDRACRGRRSRRSSSNTSQRDLTCREEVFKSPLDDLHVLLRHRLLLQAEVGEGVARGPSRRRVASPCLRGRGTAVPPRLSSDRWPLRWSCHDRYCGRIRGHGRHPARGTPRPRTGSPPRRSGGHARCAPFQRSHSSGREPDHRRSRTRSRDRAQSVERKSARSQSA